MARLRVATVIGRLSGGVGKVALSGALALDPAAYEATVVTGGGGREDAAPKGAGSAAIAVPGDLTPRALAAGMNVIRVAGLEPPLSPRGDLAALRALIRVLGEGGYDVVHTHSARSGLLGRFAAARTGVPRIVHTWHGLPFHESQPWPRRQVSLGLERLAARHTDAFLAVGSQTVLEAVRLGLAGPERIRESWPAVDLTAFERADATWAQARRRLDLPIGVKVVGSVGRLVPGKGPDLFLRALARMPDDVFGLWAGDGPMRDRLDRLTTRLGLTDRVRWLGHRDDVAEVLPAFDVMAVTSGWEGSPSVLVEGVGAGIPLVATAVPANHDLVQPGETGLLVPARPVPLAEAITWILEHPVAARAMTERARDRLGERYSPTFLGAVLDDTYRGSSRRPLNRLRGPLRHLG
ncbi:glycosyltransferase [Actinomadura scrupuli]|uniref:glycosyltransferase n=1 Tax=Actinomadura scrupuli TaxID=559629 RepID=UPI003D9559D0